MKCHSLRDAIVERARGGELGPGTRAAVESHIEHCRSCAGLLSRERQLSQGLRALAATTAADGSSDAVQRRLREIFAERQGAGQPAAAVAATRSEWTRWLRVAAALLVAAGAVAGWRMVRSGPRTDAADPRTTAVAELPKPEQPQVPSTVQTSVPDGRRPSLAGDRTGRARAAGRQVRAVAPPVVRPVGFVELPGAVGLPDFESGQIIRMEIPVTSLPTYGIEILPDAQGTPVEADLLVGQDGQARAIRLVQAGAGS
jgi:Putative zinc-finger